jgi:hypothetical protein
MKLLIHKIPLKHFLLLFKPDDKIYFLQLGDVWHPSAGFVDEKILGDVETVQQLLDFDYDFKGLVFFAAVIDEIKIDHHGKQFELTGNKKQIDKLVDKIRRLNPLPEISPKFEYDLMRDYH